MDKQKISIDDLFRQQLSDREEAMPPGAWSRMSDLLDQQPSRVLAGRNRGKGGILLLLTGLLALGAGGYVYQSHQSEPNTTTLDPQSPAVASTPGASAETTGTAVSERQPTKPVASGAVGSAVQSDRSESTSETATPASGNATSPDARPIAATTEIPSDPTNTSRQVIPLTRQSVSASQAVASTTPKANPNTTGTITPARPERISGGPAPVTPAPIAREAAPINPLQWIQSSVDAVFQGPVVLAMHPERVIAFLQNTLTPAGATASGTAATPPATWSAKSPRTTAANAPVLASGAATIPLAVTNPTPAPASASAMAPKTTPVSAVPETPQVPDTAVAVQESHFIGGILAGINSTLSGGSGALQGIQAGIYGLLKLNERWSLGGELQYLYRLNNSMNLKDDYYTGSAHSEGVITRNGQTYYPVRYDVDSMVSRYSFGSYSSLALPLYLQYNRDRFSVYGGLNLGFHLRPNVERADVKIATISRFDTLAAGTPVVAPASRASDVALSDFDSRFSVGYLAGAKYQITPQIHLDLRVSQQLWDNLRQRSVGAAKVSETYLYLPTIQLSAGYRFRNHPKPKPQQP